MCSKTPEKASMDCDGHRGHAYNLKRRLMRVPIHLLESGITRATARAAPTILGFWATICGGAMENTRSSSRKAETDKSTPTLAMMYDLPTCLRRSVQVVSVQGTSKGCPYRGQSIGPSNYFLPPFAGAACPGLGRLAPYLERPRRRFETPSLSRVPRTM